ncbi:MAG: class I SAM-dependent methyltransferase [Bryobacterales bacterium]|nr:class I SAM-dependent methyltransferase [Bryobacterales bacterium]
MGSFRQRGLAWLMAKGTERYERMVAPRKRALFAGDLGDVVEIGAGTGPNLRYLEGSRSYLAIEPNPYMHPHLRAEIDRQRVEGSLLAMPAEVALAAMPDGSVDTVISTLVLCSVPKPGELLDQIVRVLRPAGRILLLEHVGAQPGTALHTCQRCLTPAFRFFADGCRPHRDTRSLVEASRFQDVCLEEFCLPLGPISPHLCGWASK